MTIVTKFRWNLPPTARDIVVSQFVGENRRLFLLHTLVVMPDHVHAVINPATDHRGITYPLSLILGRMKGSSSRFINLALHRVGHVWQNESHDHEIRHDESLRQKCEYVAANPVRRGLVNTPDEYRWLWRSWIDDVTG